MIRCSKELFGFGNQQFLQSDQVLGQNISTPAQQTSSINEYKYPTSKDLLLQNFTRLRGIKLAYENVLSEALKDVQGEAKMAIRYHSANRRVYEANVLECILVDSPETYGETAVHEQNKQYEASQRLEEKRSSEQQCGRLFLVIKSSTLPSYLNPSPIKSVSISDIKCAERYLSDLIKRLKLSPFPVHGPK
ncbi:uncharacterized protein DFL_003680 [Arthrobotrys flagrans]|uniref:Uncharacterized protein n=1 Tax=Arthrobotrys flagrans TaxID=97331 RepID=A0A437A2J3_ARTFL|nr:hypothetical protein DFL_003680 [Arthrobotrys flagrans]